MVLMKYRTFRRRGDGPEEPVGQGELLTTADLVERIIRKWNQQRNRVSFGVDQYWRYKLISTEPPPPDCDARQVLSLDRA